VYGRANPEGHPEGQGNPQAESGRAQSREHARRGIHPENLVELDLSRNNLTSLPPEIERLSWLQDISVSHNELNDKAYSLGQPRQWFRRIRPYAALVLSILTRAEGEALRAFRQILFARDPQRHFAGLRR
ncbi:MAG: hypothetical protein ACRDN0_11700, partial [Trebonia sp.]